MSIKRSSRSSSMRSRNLNERTPILHYYTSVGTAPTASISKTVTAPKIGSTVFVYSTTGASSQNNYAAITDNSGGSEYVYDSSAHNHWYPLMGLTSYGNQVQGAWYTVVKESFTSVTVTYSNSDYMFIMYGEVWNLGPNPQAVGGRNTYNTKTGGAINLTGPAIIFATIAETGGGGTITLSSGGLTAIGAGGSGWYEMAYGILTPGQTYWNNPIWSQTGGDTPQCFIWGIKPG